MNITRERIKSIDGLRFIAIVSVLIFHIWDKRLTGGFIGVDIFFVISGYVVTNSIFRNYQRTKSFSLVQFLLARARRILIPLSLLIVLIGVYAYFATDKTIVGIIRQSLIASIFFVPNWNEIVEMGNYFFVGWIKPTEHFWSLGVEEQFYLFIAFLSFFALNSRRQLVFKNAFFVLFVASLVSFFVAYTRGANIQRVYMGTDTRAFQIALGALLVFSKKRQLKPWVNQIISGLLLLLMVVLFFIVNGTNSSYFTWGIFLISFSTAILIYLQTNEDNNNPSLLSKLLQNRIIQIVGIASYEIYLWHVFVMVIFDQGRFSLLGLQNIALIKISQFGMSIFLGILTYYFFSTKLSGYIDILRKKQQILIFLFLFPTLLVFVIFLTRQWEERPDYASPYHENSPDEYDEYYLMLGNSVQRGIFPVIRDYLESKNIGAISSPAFVSCASFFETSHDPKVSSTYHCSRSFEIFLENTLESYNISTVILFKTYTYDGYIKTATDWIGPDDPDYFDYKAREIMDLGIYLEQQGVEFAVVYIDAPAIINDLETNPQNNFIDYLGATSGFSTYNVILNNLPCEFSEPTENVLCRLPFNISYVDEMHFDDLSKLLLSEYLYELLSGNTSK